MKRDDLIRLLLAMPRNDNICLYDGKEHQFGEFELAPAYRRGDIVTSWEFLPVEEEEDEPLTRFELAQELADEEADRMRKDQ